MDLQAAFAQGFSLMIQRVFHRHVNLILLFLYQYLPVSIPSINCP